MCSLVLENYNRPTDAASEQTTPNVWRRKKEEEDDDDDDDMSGEKITSTNAYIHNSIDLTTGESRKECMACRETNKVRGLF